MNIDPRIEEFLENHFSDNQEFLDALHEEMEPYEANYHLSKFKIDAMGFTNDNKNVYLSDTLIDESKYDRFFLIFTMLHETRHTTQEKDFDTESFEEFAEDIQNKEDEANDFAFDVMRRLSELGYKEEINEVIVKLSEFIVSLVKSGFLKNVYRQYYDMKSDYEIDDIVEQ